PEGEPDRRAELVAVLLLLGAAGCAVVFIVAYVLDWPDLTQYLGLAIGVAFALVSIAMIVMSRRLVVTEEIEEEYPEPEHPEEQQKLLQVVHESGSRITRKRLLGGARDRRGADRARGLPRPVPRHRVVLRLAVAARPAARRRGGPAVPRRRHRGRHVLHRVSTGRRPRAAGGAARGRPHGPGRAAAPRRPPRVGPAGHPRLLEDLHARGLRDRALPQAAVPRGRAAPRARVPVPLLDVRPGQGRHGHLRPGRAQPPAAAAAGRPPRRPARGGQLVRAGRPVVLGSANAEAALDVIYRTIRFLDERTGGVPFIRKTLRYLFPDHWSFLLGEVALYAFVVLVGTGIYLTLFFEPSTAHTVYHGSYA